MSELKTHVSLEDGNLVYGSSQDVSEILRVTQAQHNEGLHGGKDMKLAARIPKIVVEKYCNDKGITFNEFMANKHHIRVLCNDPSLKAFRVWPGRL